MKGGKVEILKQWLDTITEKTFFENFFEKVLVVQKIVLTFASAFAKKAIKKSSLKDLDMDKQVVQDYLY